MAANRECRSINASTVELKNWVIKIITRYKHSFDHPHRPKGRLPSHGSLAGSPHSAGQQLPGVVALNVLVHAQPTTASHP